MPGLILDVEKSKARGVRDFRAGYAGQAEADIVLGIDDHPGPGIIFRLILLEPENLATGIARQHLVIGHTEKAFQASGSCSDLLALALGALVIPEDGLADHLVAFIEGNHAMHLAGQANGSNGDSRDGSQDLLEGFDGASPPVRRILLGPAWFGRMQGVAFHGGGQDPALRGEGQDLDPGGPNVYADQTGFFHGFSPLFLAFPVILLDLGILSQRSVN